jgi:hypothetical protein
VNIDDFPPEYQKQIRRKIGLEDRHTRGVAKLEPAARHEPVAAVCCAKVDSPVGLLVRTFRKRPCDVDNTSIKGFLDGIVAAGFLESDALSQVKEITYREQKSDRDETVMEFNLCDVE